MHPLLFVFAAFCGASALLYVAYRLILAWRIRQLHAEMRARGFPATLAELEFWHKRPPELENAVPLLLKARNMLLPEEERTYPEDLEEALGLSSQWLTPSIELPDCVTGDLPPLGERLSRTRHSQLTRYLQTQKDILDLLRTAAARPRFRSGVDFTQWPASCSTDELEAASKGVELLTRRAAVAANSGHSENAAEDLVAAFALSRLVAQEPTLMAQIARSSALNTSLEALEWCLSVCPFPETPLTALQETLEQAEQTNTMGRAFAGERCLVRGGAEKDKIDEITLSFEEEDPKLSDVLKEQRDVLTKQGDALKATGIDVGAELATLDQQIREAEEWERDFDEQHAEFEESMEGFIKDLMGDTLTLRTPKRGSRDELRWLTQTRDIIELTGEPLDRAVEALREFTEIWVSSSRPSNTMSELPFDVHRIFVDLCNRTHARLARVSVAAERFHHKHGVYPESLQRLCPEFLEMVPSDPFLAEEPISYARTRDKHALVWSSGPPHGESYTWGRKAELQFRVGLRTQASAE